MTSPVQHDPICLLIINVSSIIIVRRSVFDAACQMIYWFEKLNIFLLF